MSNPGLPIAIAIVMLAVAAAILTVTKAPVAEVPKCETCQSGITAIIGILGLAWLCDTFINANRDAIIGSLSADPFAGGGALPPSKRSRVIPTGVTAAALPPDGRHGISGSFDPSSTVSGILF